MKKILMTISIAAILGLFILTSCRVENRGPVGPPGKDGWSDIKIVDFDILYNYWQRDNSEPNYWFFIYNTSLIDWYVVDKGAVLFYYGDIENDGNVNKWFFIPFTNIYWDEAYQNYFEKIYDASYSFETLEVTIRDTYPDFLNRPAANDVRIKAVILEGDYYSMIKNDEVDLSDINKLQSALENYNISVSDTTK